MPSPAQLSSKTLERLRQKLVDEKQRLLHQADELAAEAEQLATEREAGDTQFDEESGEGDTVNVERERDLLLSASARQIVEEIDEALARLRDAAAQTRPGGWLIVAGGWTELQFAEKRKPDWKMR